MASLLTEAPDTGAEMVSPGDGADQGELFGELFFFIGEENVPAALYARHTGTTAARRDWVVQTVAELHVQRFSGREIARICGVSRNTVAALIDQLRGSGKLEPVKKRRAERLDRIMEKQLDEYEDGLDKQVVPAREIPVHFGIFSDKRRDLEESMEVAAAPAVGLSAAALNELIAGLPEAAPGPGASGALPAGGSDEGQDLRPCLGDGPRPALEGGSDASGGKGQ